MKRVCLIISLLLALCTSSLIAEELGVGIITFVKGTVTVIRSGERLPLKVDAAIYKSDIIETGELSKVRLVLCGGGLEGTKALGPSQRLEVASIADVSSECPNWTDITGKMLESLSTKEKTSEGALATRRYSQNLLILHPRGKIFQAPCQVTLMPVDKASSYEVTVVWESETDLHRKTFSGLTNEIQLDVEQMSFISGRLYTLSARALEGTKVLEQENDIIFYLASQDIRENLAAIIEKLSNDFKEVQDPTEHLLLGNLFCVNKLYSDAVGEYATYARLIPESKLARVQLKEVLYTMGFGTIKEETIEKVIGP